MITCPVCTEMTREQAQDFWKRGIGPLTDVLDASETYRIYEVLRSCLGETAVAYVEPRALPKKYQAKVLNAYAAVRYEPQLESIADVIARIIGVNKQADSSETRDCRHLLKAMEHIRLARRELAEVK